MTVDRYTYFSVMGIFLVADTLWSHAARTREVLLYLEHLLLHCGVQSLLTAHGLLLSSHYCLLWTAEKRWELNQNSDAVQPSPPLWQQNWLWLFQKERRREPWVTLHNFEITIIYKPWLCPGCRVSNSVTGLWGLQCRGAIGCGLCCWKLALSASNCLGQKDTLQDVTRPCCWLSCWIAGLSSSFSRPLLSSCLMLFTATELVWKGEGIWHTSHSFETHNVRKCCE